MVHTQRSRVRSVARLALAMLVFLAVLPASQPVFGQTHVAQERPLRHDVSGGTPSSLLNTSRLNNRYDVEGVQTGRLLPSSLGDFSHFGHIMAASGNTLVIGVSSTPSAFVYQRGVSDGVWVQTAQLKIAEQASYTSDGVRSVAIDGDTIIIGGYNSSGEGAVYHFQRNAGGANNWGFLAKIRAANQYLYGYFGASVAIRGRVLVVGAPGENNPIDAGTVYVYERPSTTSSEWMSTEVVTAPDRVAYNAFGSSLALNSTTLVIGATQLPNANRAPGAVYVFHRGTTRQGWLFSAKLAADGREGDNEFGYALALQDNLLAIGAPGDSRTYLFQRSQETNTQWQQRAELTASDTTPGSSFGRVVRFLGSRVVVGSPGTESSSFTGGAVYVFEPTADSAVWNERTRITPRPGEYYRSFGFAVTVAGEDIIAGAPADVLYNNLAEASYVFRLYPRPRPGDDRAITAEDTSVEIPVIANDTTPGGTGAIEPDTVTIEAAPAHGTATVNTTSGTITYTPEREYHGVEPFSYNVRNTVGAGRTATVTVTVTAVNDPPVLTSMPVEQATAHSPYHYTPSANDVDGGDTQTFSLVRGPAWLQLATVNGSSHLSGTPGDADVGLHQVELIVRDAGGLAATQQFTITVAANRPPTVLTLPITQAREGENYGYEVMAADPDPGQVLLLSVPVKPAWLTAETAMSSKLVLLGTPSYTDVGDHRVEVRVADSGGLSVTQSFTLTVQPNRPEPPQALVALPRSPDQVDLVWRDASDDEDHFAIERRVGQHAWEQIALVDANTTSYTDRAVTCGTSYTYQVLALNERWPSLPSNSDQAAPSNLVLRSLSTGTPSDSGQYSVGCAAHECRAWDDC